MARRSLSFVAAGLTLIALAWTVAFPTELTAGGKPAKIDKKPIRNPAYDPSAEQVDLFDAVDAGQVTVKLIPKDASGGNVLIENKTGQTLTVKVPDAVAGISVHAQLMNNPGGLFGQGQQMLGQNNNLTGGQQVQGGGLGQNPGQGNQGNNVFGNNVFGNNNAGNGQAPGLNFFSVPAEKVVSVTFTSVCLEHGKPEPTSASKYTLVPLSRVSKDPVLHQLLASISNSKVDRQAVQAAAWHLTDQMSFEQLAEETDGTLGGLLVNPMFTSNQLASAKRLLAQAKERSEEVTANVGADQSAEPQAKPVRVAKN